MNAQTNQYDFFSPPRIVFGWGRRREAGTLAAALGRRAFIIVGSRKLEAGGALAEITESLRAAGVTPLLIGRISHEPEVADVDHVAEELRSQGAGDGDLLLAVGGGSAIDLAKAAAAMAVNLAPGGTVQDYLEGVGRGLKLTQPPLPLLAMPTTSGTGSEATKNAVISSNSPPRRDSGALDTRPAAPNATPLDNALPFKKSLRDDRMVPRAVLIDPELTVSLPPDVTAWTGMDAITQLIESYVTRKSNLMTQGLCLAGLKLAAPAIVEAVRDGASRPAREALAQAALLSGLALANSGLGLAHGVAAALGVSCQVTHGLACAVMLPAAMRVNRPVREAEFAQLGRTLTGRSIPHDADAADAAVEKIEELCAAVRVPRRLAELGVRREQLPDLVRGSRGNSLSGNPREVTYEELHQLLEKML